MKVAANCLKHPEMMPFQFVQKGVGCPKHLKDLKSHFPVLLPDVNTMFCPLSLSFAI